ncbi:SusD/RagB family nutrient-binding outer membrane lipoprotein [Spirosoma spitsbergense]|uniref:SusD/RagB family nutrient-binding outer membrane lipoprotein n=1 Tax=Spirosoma spitsbergense TaxID=431554 RepID=UPI00035DC092|nr:SusD/RagB family nutrient-binding outer membrane lipoprotein [Spirosoma spitsbergense]
MKSIMKKTLIVLVFLTGLMQVSCTENFDALNTSPTQSSAASFDANLLLPSIEFNSANTRTGYAGAILFQSMWIQILSSTSSGAATYYSNADKYVISSNTNAYIQSVWNNDYSAASYAFQMEQLTADKPALVNLNNMAKIMQVYCYSTITDVYGDVPYTQALQAKTGTTLPAYDSQQSIYTAMLAKLETATAALSAASPLPTNDAYPYKGDVSKWKKFGYSMMLKLAMRLTKVDPATAKTYAEKAAAGGVFASIDDDAYIMADNSKGFTNGNGAALSTLADIYSVRWSKTLIDYLKATNDPRLSVSAEVPPAGLVANQSIAVAGDMTPAAQIGQPNGYDLNGGATDITKAPNYPGGTGTGADATPIGKYSRPTLIYRNRDAPIFVLTYAETELLLAEAATRGFNVTGTAASHYKNGVVAGILSLAKYGATAVVSPAVATAYADANPLVAANALKQINEQYWATTGLQMNFVAAWNNWKRSGFPVLTPVNYTGNFSNGMIPRRQPYPTGEATLNTDNYNNAVGKLTGPTDWITRMYWDK